MTVLGGCSSGSHGMSYGRGFGKVNGGCALENGHMVILAEGPERTILGVHKSGNP
jgi:hypothetical protein